VPPFTIAICTRNRPAQLRRALAAVGTGHFEVIVVDQGDEPVDGVGSGAPPVRLVRDDGRGLSRARNLATAQATTEWIVFVDDDCLLAPGFTSELPRVLAEYPEVAFVSPHVEPGAAPSPDHLPAAARPVPVERIRSGRWTRPNQVGFGVCMVVRRAVALRLGGWDERFGAGVAEFPASEDIDFNYRLLRAGERCLATPRLRCRHDEWRTPADTVQLYEGYAASWAGCAIKHLRTGDLMGGLWLWTTGAWSIVRLGLTAWRHRSSVRAGAAEAQVRGYLRGSAVAIRRRW
jgi:GT2 family glycosyltransferase